MIEALILVLIMLMAFFIRLFAVIRFEVFFPMAPVTAECMLSAVRADLALRRSAAQNIAVGRRTKAVIHEFDPHFNWRTTEYLAKEGFNEFWNWFDPFRHEKCSSGVCKCWNVKRAS